MDRLTDATTDLKQGAGNASGFFVEGKATLQKISGMADEWKSTSHKINHLVDQPNFNANIKDTVRLAKETAVKVQQAMHELNQTLRDKRYALRHDFPCSIN